MPHALQVIITHRKNMYRVKISLSVPSSGFWGASEKATLKWKLTSAESKHQTYCFVVLKPRESVLRYKSRSSSLTFISSFCSSGSFFDNKRIKEKFILGLKSTLSQGIKWIFLRLIRYRHCVDSIITAPQL